MASDAHRQMHAAARDLADLHLRKARELGPNPVIFATVASITTGPPRVVYVTIRDSSHAVPAQFVSNSYTPVVGDAVLCLTDGNQLAIVSANG